MNAVYSEKFRAWADLWHKAEKQNDAEAQYIIASLYYSTDKKENYAKAAELLKRSAKNKYTDAMFALGTLYENGKTVQSGPPCSILDILQNVVYWCCPSCPLQLSCLVQWFNFIS